MRPPDAFDMADAEEEGDQRADWQLGRTHCDRCLARVHWRDSGARWVLIDNETNKQHTCATSAEGFDDV